MDLFQLYGYSIGLAFVVFVIVSQIKAGGIDVFISLILATIWPITLIGGLMIACIDEPIKDC